jgi:hypothetical protein
MRSHRAGCAYQLIAVSRAQPIAVGVEIVEHDAGSDARGRVEMHHRVGEAAGILTIGIVP